MLGKEKIEINSNKALKRDSRRPVEVRPELGAGWLPDTKRIRSLPLRERHNGEAEGRGLGQS